MALFEKKPKQTRLAFRLRALEIADEFTAQKRDMLANALDHAAIVLGAKGERVKMLGAYRQAAAFYRLQTGKDFAG